MKALLEYLLTHITNHPQDVKVDQTEDATGSVILTASVNPEDMGKVIGRSGRVINAIRTLTKVSALKQGLRLQVNLEEPTPAP